MTEKVHNLLCDSSQNIKKNSKDYDFYYLSIYTDM